MAVQETALIVGVGDGLSASLARLFHSEGMRVALASRNTDKLAELQKATDATVMACDAADPASVATLFEETAKTIGDPDIVVFNPSSRVRGAVEDIDPAAVRDAILITCYGGFLVGQQAAQRMIARSKGTILFTGASASVKGYPNSSAFAMGKFGLRGLAQSMARELQPKNVHVAHFVIDGGIRSEGRNRVSETDEFLEPDAIAETYLQVHRQHRSAWTWEVALRPWVENF